MKVKHTPGPWKVKNRSTISTEDESFVLADAYGDFDTRGINAKLIAAAPELLKALETIKGAFWTDGECRIERIADLKSIAEYAIQKATP